MFPKDFFAGGMNCGIKNKDKKDLAIFFSKRPAGAAGMFTSNRVKAAPVLVSQKHVLSGPDIRAIIANSGCANACNGKRGYRDAETMCALLAQQLGLDAGQVLVASTGVIGQPLPLARIDRGVKKLAAELREGAGSESSAAEAIMTTDTFPKVAARRIILGRKQVTIWGCAKGSGMIHPDLRRPHATMLSFILTDAAIGREALRASLASAVSGSFNCVSVDGDTSTNDTVLVLANGAAGNRPIGSSGAAYRAFSDALGAVCLDLAKMIARDGEGATRLVEIEVRNARNNEDAKKVAATIATSPLVKTAIFGNDANWGRIMAACGRAGVAIDPERIAIFLGTMPVARWGRGVDFSERRARRLLDQKEVKITVDLGQAKGKATYYTCDFSFDYVKINASYRS